LKQRREIESGTAFYIDQSAVRAARHGRVLVLEGIEKVRPTFLLITKQIFLIFSSKIRHLTYIYKPKQF